MELPAFDREDVLNRGDKMKYFGNELSTLHKELNAIIRKPDKLEDAKQLFFKLHSKLHLSSMTGTEPNEVDSLLNDLTIDEYKMMPTSKDETIAWVLWHIARIEDLTMGILVANDKQLFDNEWKRRLNTPITDTGNALSDDEIMELSSRLNIEELIEYRNAVGQRTHEIVSSLSADDMRRKVSTEGPISVKQAGGVTDHENSLWLLDFWGKKDISGLLLMPPTRHVILHLNDCCKWKQHIRDNKKCFRRS